MKKKIKNLKLLAFIGIMLISTVATLFALNLTNGIIGSLDTGTDLAVFNVMAKDGVTEIPNKWASWGVQRMRTQSGKTYVVYCMSPVIDRDRDPNGYTTSNQLWNRMSATEQKKAWLSAYFGYGYGGDTNGNRYLAAQELQWETLPVRLTAPEFVSTAGDYFKIKWNPRVSEVAAIASYKSQIQALVNPLLQTAQYENRSYVSKWGEEIVINDSTNTLNHFDVIVGSGVQVVSKTNSELVLKITSPMFNPDVKLRFKTNNNTQLGDETLFWESPGHQPLFSIGGNNPMDRQLNVGLVLAGINFEKKVDGVPAGGVTFAVSRNADMSNPFFTGVTNSQGILNIPSIPAGVLYYQEISVPAPQLIDKTIRRYDAQAGANTIDVYNQQAKGRIQVIKTGDANQRLAGVTFDVMNSSNQKVTSITTNANGVATINDLVVGRYTLVETSAPYPYVVAKNPIPFEVKYINDTTATIDMTVNVTNQQPTGRVKVIKTGESNERIAGVTFDVFNTNNQKVTSITTNANGEASFENLALGNYSLVETSAPAPYVIDKTPIPFEIKYVNDKTYVIDLTLNVGNKQPRGRVTVVKVGELGETIEGVTFDLLNSNGDIIDTVTTDANGEIVMNGLPLGSYSLLETSAPYPYVISEEPVPFEVTYINDQTPIIDVALEVLNYKFKGQINVVKYLEDIPSRKPVSNDKFNIKHKLGINYLGQEETVDITSKTGYGIVRASYLTVLNDYVEFSSERFSLNSEKDGYSLTTVIPSNLPITPSIKGIKFEVLDENGDIRYTDYLSTMLIEEQTQEEDSQIQPEETITETGEERITIEGVVFSLSDTEGNVVATLTTDENGVASFENLDEGTYILEEIFAPHPYVLTDENKSREIEISYADDRTPIVVINEEFENKEYRGELVLVKNDNFKTLVSDAEYTLFSEDGEIIDIQRTNENGEIHFTNLKEGNYTFKETKAPTGWDLDETVYEYAVEYKDDKTPTVVTIREVVDKRTEVDIVINKTDGYNQQNLANVEFELINEETEETFKLVTDENGKASATVTFGDYRLVETKPLVGYDKMDDESIVVVGDEENREIVLDIENQRTEIDIKIVKTDGNTGIKLEGVEFEFINVDTNEKIKLVTDENGEANLTTTFGNYILSETSPLEGYDAIEDMKVKVVGNEKNGEMTIEVKNYETPEVTQTGDVPSIGNNIYAVIGSVAIAGYVIIKNKKED